MDKITTVRIESKSLILTITLDRFAWPKGYGVLFVDFLHPTLMSANYSTKELYSGSRLKLYSRNSPAVLSGGKIYLHGAFAEFNRKPYVFPIEHLVGHYLKEGYCKDRVIDDLLEDLTTAASALDFLLEGAQ